MDPLELFRVRMMSDKDLGFVARHWKSTLYDTGLNPDGAKWSNKAKSTFFNLVNAPIDILLAEKITEVVLDPIDRTYIMGWCCYDAEAIHYVYVRESLRNSGIGGAMLARAGIDKRAPVIITHKTTHEAAEHIAAKHKAIYAPRLVYDNAKAQDGTNKRTSPILA